MKKIYITFILIICIFFCNSSLVFASDDEFWWQPSEELEEIADEMGLVDENGDIDWVSFWSFIFSYASYGLGTVLSESGEYAGASSLLNGVTATIGQTLCPEEYNVAVAQFEGTVDEEAREEIYNNFCATLLETMVSQNAISYDIADNTLTISEDLASLYQAYLQNNVAPYVVHYSIPIEEVPASLFQNIGMIDYIRNTIMTNEEYNGESTSENRVAMIRPYGNWNVFVEYYDVTGLSFVINNSLTLEDYDYSRVGGTFNSNFVNSFNSNGVKSGNGVRVLLSYGGSLSLPYVYTTGGTNNYWNFYYTYDKNNQSYSFSYFVHASGDARPILFFRDSTALMEYMSGQSSCYMIPTDYTGGDLSVDLDMDYDEMYEAIQKAIQNGSFVTPSDLQSIIDSAVKEYQQEMLDQLHDINNSLNNESGYSWLRLIYNYLNERLTTTLSDLNNDIAVLSEKLDSIINLLNEILVNGGGGGSSISANGIEEQLGIVIENQTITNHLLRGVIEDLDECYKLLEEISNLLRELLNKYETDYGKITDSVNDLIEENNDKFPFSLPHDYYLLFSIFESKPITPYFDLPIDIESLNIHYKITLSLSGFEPLGKLSRIFFGVIFIFALIPLTLKIIDANERLVS